jgi:hypothetical protein
MPSFQERGSRHVWLCFPRLDADPLFNVMLGGTAPETGFLETRLRDQRAARQRYLLNTAVLETVLTNGEGGQAHCARSSRLRPRSRVTASSRRDRRADSH